MATLTISRKARHTDQFVTIPRAEYEELLVFKRIVPVFKPTKSELRAIALGRKELKKGDYVSWQTIKHGLANRRSRPRKKTA